MVRADIEVILYRGLIAPVEPDLGCRTWEQGSTGFSCAVVCRRLMNTLSISRRECERVRQAVQQYAGNFDHVRIVR